MRLAFSNVGARPKVIIQEQLVSMVSVTGLALAGIGLLVCWTLAKWIFAFIYNLIWPDSTPELGKYFTLRDIFQDVGLDNDTRKALEEGYYKVSGATSKRHELI